MLRIELSVTFSINYTIAMAMEKPGIFGESMSINHIIRLELRGENLVELHMVLTTPEGVKSPAQDILEWVSNICHTSGYFLTSHFPHTTS